MWKKNKYYIKTFIWILGFFVVCNMLVNIKVKSVVAWGDLYDTTEFGELYGLEDEFICIVNSKKDK